MALRGRLPSAYTSMRRRSQTFVKPKSGSRSRAMVAPRDGYYDLRITAELWEAFYIDDYSLMIVDHPKGTDVYSDERFAVPPPKLQIYATSTAQPFARAVDDRGNDVGAIVRDTDQRYLDTFGRGAYQGVTRDHWVELELPENAPRTVPLYLIAEGWRIPPMRP